MARTVIRVLTDPNHPDSGPLVAEYDPDANNGAGQVRVTNDPAQALTFPTGAEAMACYMQVSTVQPTRPDGQPNRPLTAYTVALDNVES